MSDEKTYTQREFLNTYKICYFQFDDILEFDKFIVSGPTNEPEVKWYWDGRLHTISYLSFIDSKWYFHRDRKPAFSFYYKNGSIKVEWYMIMGELHRKDGPAVIKYDKTNNVISTEYWHRGVKQEQLITKRAI